MVKAVSNYKNHPISLEIEKILQKQIIVSGGKEIDLLTFYSKYGSTEITHILDEKSGWTELSKNLILNNLFFIGTCSFDGDLFSTITDNGKVIIFKGQMNSGFFNFSN